jgi:hypothetical protein
MRTSWEQQQKKIQHPSFKPHSNSFEFNFHLQFNLIFSEEIIQYARTFNFHLQFNLIFSEEIIQYSRTSTPQVKTS